MRLITDEEAELSDKVYNLVKDLEGLVEMQCHSDGIHDRGKYSLHFSKYTDLTVLLDTSKFDDETYMESWRKEREKRSRAYEMYGLSIYKHGLEVRIPADSSRTSYILPDKIKNYFSQKLPCAELSQPCINVFRWEYKDPQEFKRLLG